MSLSLATARPGATIGPTPRSAPDRTAARPIARASWTCRAALRYLPPHEREAIRLRYAEGLSQKEVGKAMRVSKARAQQIESRALARLRAALGAGGAS